ncbi:MAG: SUMF1/EgtB/PvdO family nonheme iron enzyme [Treponema sp.]|nr:SUMF1/EgtB/PvdO family nonheme iron enzyme [Treponema sp.]
MKKIFTILCLVLAGSLSFAGGGEDVNNLREAKYHEQNESYVTALHYYYEAMAEKPTAASKEAYEGYCRILEKIRSGDFGNESWPADYAKKKLLRVMDDFEDYCFSYCPFEFNLYYLVGLDSLASKPSSAKATPRSKLTAGKKTTRTKRGAKESKSDESPKYLISISTSYKPHVATVLEAIKEGWKNLCAKYHLTGFSGWPESCSVQKLMEGRNFECSDGTIKHLTLSPETYKLTFDVVDKNDEIRIRNFAELTPSEDETLTNVNPTAVEYIQNHEWRLVLSKIRFVYPETTKDSKLIGKTISTPWIHYEASSIVFNSDGKKTSSENYYEKLRKICGPYKMKKNPVEPVKMVKVEGGTFKMATTGGDAIWYEELGGSDKFYEKYGKPVKVSTFYMSEKLITQAQWFKLIGTNPSTGQFGDDFGVENISWFDAVYFCNLLSKKEGLQPCYTKDGMSDVALWDYEPGKGKMLNGGFSCDFSANGYRLLTDAEWVHACPSYDEFERLDEWVWDTYKELTKDYEEDPRETYVCGGQHITRGIKADKGCDARTLRKPQDPEKTTSIFWGGLGFRVARSKM